MRIGYFTSIDGWGGSEAYIRDLMAAVRDRGHVPVLFGVDGTRLMDEACALGIETVPWTTSRAVVSAPDTEADVARSSPVRPKRASAVRRLLGGCVPPALRLLLGNVREAGRLRSLFRRNAVDVMHVTVHGYEMAGVAARGADIPVLGVFQTSPIAEPYWVRRLLIRYTARAYRRVCVVSRFNAVEWRARLSVAERRWVLVRNAIRVARFTSIAHEGARGADGPFRVLSIGRLHPMKGFCYLIEAVASVTTVEAHLDIVGSGEEEAMLRALVDRLGAVGRVRFHGHLERYHDLMARADCFALVSVSHEGLPLALLEAMAAGMPLVTSDYGALPEVNADGETGLVVPARDSAALARALGALAADPARAARMGTAARARVQSYDHALLVDRMLELYESVRRESETGHA